MVYVLVDCPGFQSTHIDHDVQALTALPDASVLIYLFKPNMMTGDTHAVNTVLRGDPTHGILSKLRRTFLIINRADELGIDPEEDPQGYLRLADRKKLELAKALECQDIHVAPQQILCMASDPFGLVGDRKDVNADAFNRFRHWDGFAQFLREFRIIRSSVLRTGIDRSILEGGVARLARLMVHMEQTSQQLQAQHATFARLATLLDEAIAWRDTVSRRVYTMDSTDYSPITWRLFKRLCLRKHALRNCGRNLTDQCLVEG